MTALGHLQVQCWQQSYKYCLHTSPTIDVTFWTMRCHSKWPTESHELSWYSLRWRHNRRDCVSYHQPHGSLLNRLFRRRSKKTSKLRVTGLCAGNSPGPVNSPHKWPVTRKMFQFEDVIIRNDLRYLMNFLGTSNAKSLPQMCMKILCGSVCVFYTVCCKFQLWMLYLYRICTICKYVDRKCTNKYFDYILVLFLVLTICVSLPKICPSNNVTYDVSNYRQFGCLFNSLLKLITKQTSKVRITARLWGNPLVIDGFSSQMTSNLESIMMSWHLNDYWGSSQYRYVVSSV